MNKDLISTVITYCSLDRKFIIPLITETKKFSNEIILVCFDHLLTGTPDDVSDVLNISGVKTIVLPFDSSKTSNYLHNLSRWKGALNCTKDWVLFLDADEILDGEKFKEYVDANTPFKFDFSSFDSYWYFREPTYQATTTEWAGLLMKRILLDKAVHFSPGERWAYTKRPGISTNMIVGIDNTPILHHFSWVRTKEEMLEKVKGWGHKNDRDWISPIIEEFSRDFNGRDFVHGYTYKIVDNQFNIKV